MDLRGRTRAVAAVVEANAGYSRTRLADAAFQAGYNAALTLAVQVCEAEARRWDTSGAYVRNDHSCVPQDGCDECADAIRALLTKPASAAK